LRHLVIRMTISPHVSWRSVLASGHILGPKSWRSIGCSVRCLGTLSPAHLSGVLGGGSHDITRSRCDAICRWL